MWRALLTCLVLVVPATGALAAERVLLYPSDVSQAARSAGSPASLSALRKTAIDTGTVSVIVGLKVPFAPEGALTPAESGEQRAEIAAAASAVQSKFASAVSRSPKSVRSFGSIPFMAMEVTPAELERLAADPNVISIIQNRKNKAFLRQSLPMIEGDKAHAAGFTATGQSIAIIDTGVDKNHPFFGGRVVSEACYSTNGFGFVSLCPGGVTSSTAPGSGMACDRRLEGCDHGTHVAGIAAGANSTMQGVARSANIIAIQVFSKKGPEIYALDSDILAALARVYALRGQFSIAAVNMSLGSGRYNSTCDAQSPAYLSAIGNLKAAGIATVVSSGNEGYTNSIALPACYSNAVSVGAVSTRNWGDCFGAGPTARDKVACYSNSASLLTLLAPGSPINSSVLRNRYANFHGTSMAAPHVAGAFAVIKQKAPNATVDEILEALRDTGTPVTDYRNRIIKPRINVKAALDEFPSIPQTLTFQRQGTGQGSVAFSPAGSTASCSENCTNTFGSGTIVAITATPATGSVFGGWSGACSGTAPSCTVAVARALNVSATFTTIPTFALSYTRAGTGQGSVTFSPAGSVASCTANCSNVLPANTRVRLQATAAAGSSFRGWQGACRGMRSCVVSMTEARAATATFDLVPSFALTYDAQGTGTGTVSFSRPTGVTPCTGDCTNSFAVGTRVTLTARADANSTFTGWDGACKGRRSCKVTMSQVRTVTATFTATTPTTTIGALPQP
jgi:subtilisin family serine protease